MALVIREAYLSPTAASIFDGVAHAAAGLPFACRTSDTKVALI